MSPTESTSALQPWLRQLRLALAALPADEREDILSETRSHLNERIAQGHSAKAALAALGHPQDYAQGFLENYELAHAISSRRLPSMLDVALRRAHRSARIAGALLGLALLVLLALAAVITAVMHFIDPAHWGLWLGPRFLVLGTVDSTEQARELLGIAIYPLALLVSLISWQLGRSLLHRALKQQTRQALREEH